MLTMPAALDHNARAGILTRPTLAQRTAYVDRLVYDKPIEPHAGSGKSRVS